MIPIIRHFGITVGNAKKTSGLQGCRDRKIKNKVKLAGYSPWGPKESDMTERLRTAKWSKEDF